MKAKLEERNAQSAYVAALGTDATFATGLAVALGSRAVGDWTAPTSAFTATSVDVRERRWTSIISQLQTTYLYGVQAFDIYLS